MSYDECYIRFIITKPEGEVIINLILSGHEIANIFHEIIILRSGSISDISIQFCFFYVTFIWTFKCFIAANLKIHSCLETFS